MTAVVFGGRLHRLLFDHRRRYPVRASRWRDGFVNMVPETCDGITAIKTRYYENLCTARVGNLERARSETGAGEKKKTDT